MNKQRSVRRRVYHMPQPGKERVLVGRIQKENRQSYLSPWGDQENSVQWNLRHLNVIAFLEFL